MKDSIYLSGASRCEADEGKTWRDEFKKLYIGEMKVFSPNDYYDYSNKLPDTVYECMTYFLYKVRASRVVVVNLNNTISSPGTLAELAIAYENFIPIVGFGNNYEYPWAKEMCMKVCKDLKEAAEYVNEYLG